MFCARPLCPRIKSEIRPRISLLKHFGAFTSKTSVPVLTWVCFLIHVSGAAENSYGNTRGTVDPATRKNDHPENFPYEFQAYIWKCSGLFQNTTRLLRAVRALSRPKTARTGDF